MTIKRLKDMPELQRQVLSHIYKDVMNIRDVTVWRNYEKKIKYKTNDYVVKCQFKHDGFFFTYRNLSVSHPTKEIYIPQSARHN